METTEMNKQVAPIQKNTAVLLAKQSASKLSKP